VLFTNLFACNGSEACSFGTALAILHRKTLIPCPTRHRTNSIGSSEL